MATNPLFNPHADPIERELFQDLLDEFAQVRGMDVIYLPAVYLAEDTILNEVINHYHSRGMKIEAILDSYDNWENNSMSFGSLGMMQMANEAVWVISKKRFKEAVVEERLEFSERPNEGDLIYSHYHQEFFKIKKVNKEDPTKAEKAWILRTEKYDDNNEINVDMLDWAEEAGTVDPQKDCGKADYESLVDIIDDFLENDDPACEHEPKDGENAYEYDKRRKEEKEKDLWQSDQNPNAENEGRAEDLLA